MLPPTLRSIALLLLSGGACVAPALSRQDAGPPTAPPQEAIDRAIDRGVRYLLDRQEVDGSWRADEHRYIAGQTGLSVYTLVKGGLPRDHPAVRRGIEFLRHHPPRWTYGITTCILAVDAASPSDADELIGDWVQLLLDAQGTGFSYPGGHEDLSLTQYGCLGLRVAEERGIKIDPEVWEDVLRFAGSLRREDGSYSYTAGNQPSGSMTAAGVAVAQIARERLEARGKLRSREAQRIDEQITASAEWLGRTLDVTQNPFPGEKDDGAARRWKLYYLYGLERVGGLTGKTRFGGRDWYAEAAAELVRTQGAKGEWTNSHGEPHPGTCFGVLVLRRATAPSSGATVAGARSYGDDDPVRDVSLRATGDTPLTLWISSFGTAALEKHEWNVERGKGPRVTRVLYEDAERGTVLAAQTGEVDRPAAGERFAARVTFPLPGTYKVRARVFVRPIDSVASEEEELLSQVIEARVDGVMGPGHRAALADAGKNTLANTKIDVQASSQHSDGHGRDRAVDGLAAHGWLCAGTDAEPWLELDLARPQKGERLALTIFRLAPNEPCAWGRPAKIRVRMNRRELGVYDLPDDPTSKFYIDFEKRTTVRQLRIEILEKYLGENGGEAELCGFAEVELLPGT